MTAEEVYESVTNGGTSDFDAAVEIVDQIGASRLTASLAANCYAEPVSTVDADFVVLAKPSGDLKNAFVKAGSTVRRGTVGGACKARFLATGLWLIAAVSTAFAQPTPSPMPTSSLTPAPSVNPASEPAVIAVAKVLPAVVNINTERIVRRQVRDPFDEFASQFFGIYRNRPREIRQRLQSLGSGFLVDPGGYIVTNEHVVERAADLKIEVVTNDNKSYKGRYITGDAKKDLALLKIDSDKPLPFVNLHDISPNLLGQTVIVVGNALGYGTSISRGVLSGVNRDITVDNIDYHNLLQTDAAINPGNSGGPLIDLEGRLVGMSSAKMAFTPQGVPTQGLGFAIPADVVRQKIEEFRKVAGSQPAASQGRNDEETASSRAGDLFGLQLQDLTNDLADALGYTRGRGVLISAVEPDSPADEAGFERGLVIYRVGRSEVNSVAEVEHLLARVDTGSSVDFAVGVTSRNGRGRRIQTVTLEAR